MGAILPQRRQPTTPRARRALLRRRTLVSASAFRPEPLPS
jgi:hypothetical protein